MKIIGILALAGLVWIIFRFGARLGRQQREDFIDQYRFPPSIAPKVKQKYPHLTDDNLKKVIRGLREYFQICNLAGKRMVSMPSQVVDVAWHEFILFTREYHNFCNKALGKFLHHTPAEAMQNPTFAQEGIKRAWRFSCLRSHIDPKSPSRLPILFAIDSELEIPDGFKYSLNCKETGNDGYCASHIGCGGCGGGGCTGDGGDAGCGSGCGGGCGGD